MDSHIPAPHRIRRRYGYQPACAHFLQGAPQGAPCSCGGVPWSEHAAAAPGRPTSCRPGHATRKPPAQGMHEPGSTGPVESCAFAAIRRTVRIAFSLQAATPCPDRQGSPNTPQSHPWTRTCRCLIGWEGDTEVNAHVHHSKRVCLSAHPFFIQRLSLPSRLKGYG